MYRLRELMGLLLLATVIWLLFILHRLTEDGVVWAGTKGGLGRLEGAGWTIYTAAPTES